MPALPPNAVDYGGTHPNDAGLEAAVSVVEAYPGASSMTDAEFDAAVDLAVAYPAAAQASSDALDPLALLADAMVGAVTDAAPDLVARCSARGAVVVLRVPEGWDHEVGRAWLRRLHGLPPTPRMDDGDLGDWAARDRLARFQAGKPLVLDDLRRGERRAVQEAEVDGNVRKAFRCGRGVVAVAGPDRAVPSAILGAADADLVIPPPTSRLISSVAEAIAAGPAPLIASEVAAAVRSNHLLGALRPGQSAADYVERVGRLASAGRPPAPQKSAPRWTLDTLPLPPDVLAWGRQLVADLGEYAAGRLEWLDVGSSALLCGPPGCGKTTLAGTLAASCGVPLFVTSYAILESGEDGKGRYSDLLANLRKTFVKARTAAPCILFLDEIDSFLGRGQGGHNESWFAPLTNALLTECDVAAREGVILLAATNYPDRVDAALRRSGRLDRVLVLRTPDADTLARVVAAHLPTLPPAECAAAAHRLAGASGADIERLARGARRRARADGRAVVVGDILAEAGEGKAPRSTAALRRTAYHEAGHALLVALRHPGALTEVTIRSVGGTGGGTSWQPQSGEDTEDEVNAALTELLGGRAAELLVLGAPGAGSGGASDSDLARATVLAVCCETSWGFARLTWHGDPGAGDVAMLLAANPGLSVAVEERLQAALADARATLDRNRPALDAVAGALLARETLTGAEVESLVREARVPVRAVGQRAPAAAAPSTRRMQ